MALLNCPSCDQQLRIPDNIGGMAMACPVCGHEFYSDFKMGVGGKSPVAGERAAGSAAQPPRKQSRFRVII